MNKGVASAATQKPYRRLKAAALPVPGLVAFEPRAGPNGEACAIWKWVEGVPAEWQHDEPCPYDEAEFGALLRGVHSLGFEGAFGFLGDDPREAEILSSLPDRLAAQLDRAEPRLLHLGDIMHNGNMLVAPGSGRIRAILDYTESMAGDPRWELAWIRYYFADYPWDRPTFNLARFWAGYGAEYGSDDPLGRFYLLAILLFEKLRFYDPVSPRGRWAIATVKSIPRGFA